MLKSVVEFLATGLAVVFSAGSVNYRTSDMTAVEVADTIQNFIDRTGATWDWDDFICCTILEPKLDEIRRKAGDVALPLEDDGEAVLKELIQQAKMIASQ